MQKELTIKKSWFIASRKGKLEDYYDVDLKKKDVNIINRYININESTLMNTELILE